MSVCVCEREREREREWTESQAGKSEEELHEKITREKGVE